MSQSHSTGATVFSWVLRLVVAGILGMAIVPKLTANEYSVQLFEMLGAEPVGRYAVALFEVIAVVLVLIPKTKVYGAGFAVALMVGAIGSHLTKLGIAVEFADGEKDPSMFIMALIVAAAALGLVGLHRAELPLIGSKSPAAS